jgi:hypothetical protein
MKLKKLILLALFLFSTGTLIAQISILSSSINSFNITPQSIVQLNVLNNDQESVVYLECKIFNAANEIILNVKTQPFTLRKGMNSISGYNLQFSSVEYSNSNQSTYIKSIHTLPSGKFNACYVLNLLSNEPGDEYCVDLESDISSFLTLISPMDKDTVDTPNPMLVWTHSEPFNLLAPGEYFRILVTELMNEQNAESGVTYNTPTYMKNYVTTHQLLYPYDAKELQPGKHYGWQVQKLSNGVIVNKSEAWEFVLKPEKNNKPNKYAVLKSKLDAGYYTPTDGKVYFTFNEEYSSQKISCSIFNSKREVVPLNLKNENNREKNGNSLEKSIGSNCYEIDLNTMKISSGMHTLEVKNEKGEVFFLKFYVLKNEK